MVPYKRLSSLASGPLPASSEIRRGVAYEASNPCIFGTRGHTCNLSPFRMLCVHAKQRAVIRLFVFDLHHVVGMGRQGSAEAMYSCLTFLEAYTGKLVMCNAITVRIGSSVSPPQLLSGIVSMISRQTGMYDRLRFVFVKISAAI
jgi:hypothetical protein